MSQMRRLSFPHRKKDVTLPPVYTVLMTAPKCGHSGSYRDQYLATTLHGKLFIKLYYALSLFFVKILGKRKFFKAFWKRALDSFIVKLNQQGIPGLPYKDSAE